MEWAVRSLTDPVQSGQSSLSLANHSLMQVLLSLVTATLMICSLTLSECLVGAWPLAMT